ncbi:MAG: hypothetical protein OXC38_09355 [Gammaproteobacteria bacterium]|nr:hypothetical protein [Gammaproteobacteria bacterium]
MSLKVPRMCVEIGANDSSPLPRHLDEFREVYAYVLLGEPGAGKTTAFKQEAEETNGCYVTARDFVTFNGKPEWSQTTLFIDGLDEVRAGASDRLTPLDKIRRKIDQFVPSKYRLSCRMADWLGASDRSALEALSKGDENIRVLGLEPLSPEDVEAIIRGQPGVVDAEAFIESVRQNGLDYLLRNPQSLEMLALAVAESDVRWPEDRKQTFNLACRKLLEEGNPDRKRLRAVSEPDLLMAAGKLFAIQLLTGSAGYRLDDDGDHKGFLSLNQISGEDPNALCNVIDSKLFRGPQESRAEPYHRHIAEFLGAEYLAERVKAGLPVARILALTTGFDGGVVPEFRGLLAWLAARSLIGRTELIERDPYGVVEYGCAREFSADDKHRILDGLEREARMNPWFALSLSHEHRLGDLASADMKKSFLKYFEASDPDDAQQSLAHLCLQALVSGTDAPDMPDTALEMLKNPKWGLPVRRTALDLFLLQMSNDGQMSDALLALLEEVEGGIIFDPVDDLAGQLLEDAYPEILSPRQVLFYLRPPKRANYYGPYCHFWTRKVTEKSTGKQLGELLDLLVDLFNRSPEEFSRKFDQFNHLRDLPERWLEYYLTHFRDELDPYRLLHWLEAICPSRNHASRGNVTTWLSGHPDTLLELYDLGIKQCEKSEKKPDETDLCMHRAMERFADVGWPQDFGTWCLKRAIATKNPEVARHLIRRTASCVHDRFCNIGLSREIVEDRLSTRPELLEEFIKHQTDAIPSDVLAKQRQDKYTAELLERQQKWHAKIKPMEKNLRENRCRPGALHELAVAYYGGYRDVSGDTPEERLKDLLGKDESLIEAVLQAFRMSIDREDLPSAGEVIRLGIERKAHLLSYPYMAGLHEISKASQDKSLSIGEEQMRLALAIHYMVPLWPLSSRTGDETPQWFLSLLRVRPDVVSDILVETTREKFQGNADSVSGLYELAYSPDYRKVARTASLPLLKAFPVRGHSRWLQNLDHLFIAALLYCEKEALLDIIEKKLSYSSMHVGHRIRWLAAGLFTAPEKYREQLESYVAGNEPRIRALAEIMTSRFLGTLPDSPSVSVLSLLIRLLGSSYGPYYYDADDSSMMACPVTLGMDAAHSIRFFCEQLAQIPTSEATESLESLLAEEELRAWHSNLIDLTYQQKILRREAEFLHGNVKEVLQVIENASPANPTDLTAVAMMKLEEAAKDIRDGNTSDWKAYWAGKESEATPQHEDFCRDRLLSKLRPLLAPLEVDAQPEGRYANEKRSDIRFSCNGFNVPMEIKKNNSRDLWTAVRNQLIAKYIRGPGTDGNGIYLALWFGKEFCKATPSGIRPESANQLKHCLLETLSRDERRKIKVCVVDVSRQS